MDLEALEEALSDILPVGFVIETNKKGQIIVLTNLRQDDDGELVSMDDEEEDEDVDADFESLDALKKAVRSDMERHAEHEVEAGVRQQLIDQIIAANAFDVPKSWIQQFVQNYAETYQVPADQREQFARESRAMAERQIRRDLVIETLAEKEGLTATEKDLDDRIAEQAEKRGANPGQIYAQLEKSGRLKEMERSITEDKVFKWLLDRNDVSTNA